jgi:tRNA(Ile)-lysidine synthase
MVEKVISLATEYGMLPPGGRVLCAVSGGADSMCLLHLLAGLAGADGFSLAAAHYNHHLRGAESDRDEDFVRRWCAGHGISLTVWGGDVAGEARRTGQGIEETARRMRYAFLSETAQAVGGALIATAHHADDNAETLLLHLIRGTGLQGLTGIAPRRGNLVRPLLTATRAEVEDYVARHALPYVEDSTNTDMAYTRNKLRHTVMPLLRELNPRITESMSGTARYLRTDNDFLNAQAIALCQNARWAEDNLVIEAGLIADAPNAVAPRAARRLLEMLGDGDCDCSAAHLNAIVDLCRGDDPSAVCFLPGGKLVQRVYRELLLTSEHAPPAPFAPVPLHEGQNPSPGTCWTVTLCGAVPPGLTARPRQTGDELTLPRRGTKTIKKLFIDEKIPRRKREHIPVVADEAGVLALAGFGVNTAHPAYGEIEISFKRNQEKDG